jgi:hypothetical protein
MIALKSTVRFFNTGNFLLFLAPGSGSTSMGKWEESVRYLLQMFHLAVNLVQYGGLVPN